MGNNLFKKCCDVPKNELIITKKEQKLSGNEPETNHSEHSLGVNN